MNKKEFLTQEVPELLKKLEATREGNFGLMTPQHMIEHLALSLKASVKRQSEPESPPSERHQGFKRFIQKGAILKHRPSDKTKADLPELKYTSLEEAIAQIPIATKRFYDHYETNPNFVSYNKFMGELNFEELELFHYQHYRYHLWQFGLLESYP